MLHRVNIDSAWQEDARGIRHRHYLARCHCGWSAGWRVTRGEAVALGDEHRLAATGTPLINR
jgi:hypothetical protein